MSLEQIIKVLFQQEGKTPSNVSDAPFPTLFPLDVTIMFVVPVFKKDVVLDE